jgi:hypothetical protein
MKKTFNNETCPARHFKSEGPAVIVTRIAVMFNERACKLLNLEDTDKVTFEYDNNSFFLRIDPLSGIPVGKANDDNIRPIYRKSLREGLIDLVGGTPFTLHIGEFKNGNGSNEKGCWPLRLEKRFHQSKNNNKKS